MTLSISLGDMGLFRGLVWSWLIFGTWYLYRKLSIRKASILKEDNELNMNNGNHSSAERQLGDKGNNHSNPATWVQPSEPTQGEENWFHIVVLWLLCTGPHVGTHAIHTANRKVYWFVVDFVCFLLVLTSWSGRSYKLRKTVGSLFHEVHYIGLMVSVL